MVKAMGYRELHRALRQQHCELVSTRGSHEKWRCPCGNHQAIVVHHRAVSPGVVRDIISKLACLPEGWLQ